MPDRDPLKKAYFKSLHEARLLDAREAIRAGLLINGGAASAVLAFSAQLVAKNCGGVPHLVALSLVLYQLSLSETHGLCESAEG